MNIGAGSGDDVIYGGFLNSLLLVHSVMIGCIGGITEF